MNLNLVLLLIVIINRTSCEIETCDPANYMDISGGTYFSNGDIYFEGVKFDKSEYFVDNVTGVKKGCLCKKQKCVRKCCPMGQGYNAQRKVCQDVRDEFSPPVWDEYRLIGGAKATDMFRFSFGKMNCTEGEYRIRIGQGYGEYHLRADGQLFIELPDAIPPWTVRAPDKYCIDTFVQTDDQGNTSTRLDALVCFVEDPGYDPTSYVISSTCMLISCVFILATVAVYSWLPELRNLHGRVLMSYLCCLFVGFLFFATMQIMLLLNNISVHGCLGLTFIIYFSLLSGFFWLNVMSFDIWWTFSGKRGTSLEKLSARGRFCAYATYAFGVPTAMTIVLAGLEFSGLPRHPLLPNIQQQGCFIYGQSKIIYFYGPIAVLCVANCVFFILTAVRIARIKQQTAMLQSKESATHDTHRNDRQRLLLYVKLFAVMGINWLLEVISGVYPGPAAVWRYTDAYNVLIGLIIFIIFVCKRKIFRLIKKRSDDCNPDVLLRKVPNSNNNNKDKITQNGHRYHQLRGDPPSRTQTTSSRAGSSTHDMKMTTVKTDGNQY